MTPVRYGTAHLDRLRSMRMNVHRKFDTRNLQALGVLKDNWTPVAALGGALALLVAGSLPAFASTSTCPSGVSTYFTGTTVFLQPEQDNPNIWSSPVTLYAYCGSVDPNNALANVPVTAVMANS